MEDYVHVTAVHKQASHASFQEFFLSVALVMLISAIDVREGARCSTNTYSRLIECLPQLAIHCRCGWGPCKVRGRACKSAVNQYSTRLNDSVCAFSVQLACIWGLGAIVKNVYISVCMQL